MSDARKNLPKPRPGLGWDEKSEESVRSVSEKPDKADTPRIDPAAPEEEMKKNETEEIDTNKSADHVPKKIEEKAELSEPVIKQNPEPENQPQPEAQVIKPQAKPEVKAPITRVPVTKVKKYMSRRNKLKFVYLTVFDGNVFYADKAEVLKSDENLSKAKLKTFNMKGKCKDKETGITIIPRIRLIESKEFQEGGVQLVTKSSMESTKGTESFGFVPCEEPESKDAVNFLRTLKAE